VIQRRLSSSVLSLSTLLLTAAALGAQDGQQGSSGGAPEYGPARGSLVIVGGGGMAGTGIQERFIELGGGAENGRFVIVPTAGGNRDGNGAIRQYQEEQVVASWKRLGVKNVTMLHTHDPAVANTEAFVKNLREATAVWFDGGRQWNIVDSYAGTLTEREFHKVLERGGVIGGTSAGATIQGDYLTRGDTRNNTIVMTPETNHQHGFSFIRKVAIDQHINTRLRWDDLIAVVDSMPNLLGIGLSEGTAIVVSGDTFEVIGKWKVAVHDNTQVYEPWVKPYYVLAAGDVYDMKARRIVARGIGNGRRGTPPGEVGQGGGAAGRAAGAGGGR
jgi:cyanophycinase